MIGPQQRVFGQRGPTTAAGQTPAADAHGQEPADDAGATAPQEKERRGLLGWFRDATRTT